VQGERERILRVGNEIMAKEMRNGTV